MKIIECQTVPLKVPLKKPLLTRHLTINEMECLTVLIKTDNGLIGHGFARGLGNHGAKLLATYINHVLAPLLNGENPLAIEKIWNKLWLANRNRLQAGLCLYALAAIDIALWDIKGKFNQKPLYQLLNIEKKSVKVYASGGWLNWSDNQLFEDCQWYLDQGVNQYKIRIGSDHDERRLALLRDTFGDKLILYADANQHYSLQAAIDASHMLKSFGVEWFEEPLFSTSIEDLKELAKQSLVPIGTGENISSHWQFQDLCASKAADFIQPDVINCGGITEFIKIAKIISQHSLVMTTHLLHELSVSLAGLCDKVLVEHLCLFPDDLFKYNFYIKAGSIEALEVHGTGLTFSDDALKDYKIT